jgi:hypothetical protein
MTTLGVILWVQNIRIPDKVAAESENPTCILVSVFRRNHWGIGLEW